MNKMVTSALVVGAGLAAYSYSQKNNMFSRRQMKKMQKRVTRALM